MIDASHDNETMMMKTFSEFSNGNLIFGSLEIPARMLESEFWEDAHRMAKESKGDLLWHLIIGTAALRLYSEALLLRILSSNLVGGDSIALSRHPQCGLFIAKTFNRSNMGEGPYSAPLRTHVSNIACESRQYSQLSFDLAQGPGGASNADSCSFSYEPSIKYVMKDNNTCTF